MYSGFTSQFFATDWTEVFLGQAWRCPSDPVDWTSPSISPNTATIRWLLFLQPVLSWCPTPSPCRISLQVSVRPSLSVCLTVFQSVCRSLSICLPAYLPLSAKWNQSRRKKVVRRQFPGRRINRAPQNVCRCKSSIHLRQCCPTFLTPRAAQDIIMKLRAAPVLKFKSND